MTVKIDGTNTEANPAFTGADTDTGLQCGTNELKLVTGGTARATVNSAGKIGFNTTNPPRDFCFHSGQADTNIQITNNTTGVDDSAGGLIQQDGNDLYIWNKENSFMSLGTNNTEQVRIHADGTLAPKNGIFLDPGLVSGSTANMLEDYEEGTFTPIWTTTGTNFSSVTYTNQDGKYTKVGNVVHVSLRLRSSASSGGSGNLLVGGLPFNCNDSAGSSGGSPAFYNINVNNGSVNIATETRVNNNQFYLLASTDDGPWSNVNYANIRGSGVSEIRVSFDYITDS